MNSAKDHPKNARSTATVFSTLLLSLTFPVYAFAHETEHQAVLADENQPDGWFNASENWFGIPLDVLAISGMAVTAMLAAFFIIRFSPGLPMSKRKYRKGYRNGMIAATIVSFVFTVVAAIGSESMQQNSEEAFKIPHIHGMGFSADGQQLFLPVHEGIVSYHHGIWEKPVGELHDYMGFAIADNGFYASGHPAMDSELPNPLGWLRANGPGETIEHMSLLGKADFHLTAVGYRTHVQYVQAMEPNELMPLAGLIYRSEDGKAWKPIALEGIQGNLISISAHPDDANQLGVATTEGFWVSADGGTTVQKVAAELTDTGQQATGIYYSPAADLFLTMRNATGQAELYRWRLKDRDGVKQYTPPNIMQDIIYMAQHPQQPDTIAFATADLDVYYTIDRGENWLKIIRKGQALNGEVTLQEMPAVNEQPDEIENGLEATPAKEDHSGH